MVLRSEVVVLGLPESAAAVTTEDHATGWNSKLVAGISTTFSQPSIQADGTSAIMAAEGAVPLRARISTPH
jgi:hypothetical protein